MYSYHGQGLLYDFDLINFDLTIHFTSLAQLHLEDFCSDIQVQKLTSGYTYGCKKKSFKSLDIINLC